MENSNKLSSKCYFQDAGVDILNLVFSNASNEDLLAISQTSKSLKTLESNFFWNKFLILPQTNNDFSVAIRRFLCSEDQNDKQKLTDIFKMCKLKNDSIQLNICDELIELITNGANPDERMIQLFNIHACPKPFKIKILEDMNLMSFPVDKGLKWTKKRKKGFVPKNLNSFNFIEIPSKLVPKIKIHPENEFKNGELVAVIAKKNYRDLPSLFFGVVKDKTENMYTISNYFTENNEFTRIQLKKAFEIGKLPSKTKLPRFCSL